MHFTQNPIGSDDQLDLQDNAISFDYAMNSPAALWQDRFGKQHKTVQQALKDVGFKPAGFDFVSGGTLGIGDRDKSVFYPTDGCWYSWNGQLPYVIPANSSPTPGGRKGWGVVDSGNFLRKELLAGPIVERNNKLALRDLQTVGDFGLTPDYIGTPEYDGEDSNRVTCTDNTPLLLTMINSPGVIKNGILHLKFIAGHYGFKTKLPKMVGSGTFHTIIIEGEGKELTTLDFVYEDTSKRVVVDSSSSNRLFDFEGFKTIIFKDIRTKCTTKAGCVDGSTDSSPTNASVYYGSVWFSQISKCTNVKFIRNKMDHANFRGHSVEGDKTLPKPNWTEVEIVDCEGCYNTSTGYWLSWTRKTTITGGSFYRNGTLGLTATGYGIAHSQGGNNIIITGARFFENYRKGYDRHGGSFGLTIKDSVFIDNVMYDIYDNRWNTQLYDKNTEGNRVIIDNCLFILNSNKTFLSEAMAAIAGNSRKHFWHIGDRNQSDVQEDLTKYVSITNCVVKTLDVLTEQYDYIDLFTVDSPITDFSNISITLDGLRYKRESDAYGATFFRSNKPNSVIRVSNCPIIQCGDCHGINNGEYFNKPLFTLYGNSGLVSLTNNNITLENMTLFGSTATGKYTQWNGPREILDNVLRIKDLKLSNFSGSNVSNGLYHIYSNWMLKTPDVKSIIGANKIKLGDNLPYFSTDLYSLGLSKPELVTIDCTGKQVGNKFTVLTGLIDGNFSIDLTGKMSLGNESYNLSVFYQYSSKTKVVSKTSTMFTPGDCYNFQVTNEGAPTSFLLTAVDFVLGGNVTNPGMVKIETNRLNYNFFGPLHVV